MGGRVRFARTVLMLVTGSMLLLPGLCSLGFMRIAFQSASRSDLTDPAAWMIVALWVICFVIGWRGIRMIIASVRGDYRRGG